MGFRSALRIERVDGGPADGAPGVVQPIRDPLGIIVGAAAPVPLRGWLARRLYVGMVLYIVPEEVVRVIAHPPEEPLLPYYDNRTQRLLVLPSLALRLPAGLSVGVGINFLAGLEGRVQAAEGATRAVEARVDEQVLSTARVNVGLRWRSPAGRFAAALVYRQRFSVPFSTTTRSSVAGQPLDIDVVAEGLYTPDQLVLGGAARALPWLLLSADLTVGFLVGVARALGDRRQRPAPGGPAVGAAAVAVVERLRCRCGWAPRRCCRWIAWPRCCCGPATASRPRPSRRRSPGSPT